jgi:hypothetical protein
MNDYALQSFGTAVILAGGVVVIGHTAGYPYGNVGFFGVAVGLAISLLGLFQQVTTTA